jgi:sugar phosphate isomerase/epimerase
VTTFSVFTKPYKSLSLPDLAAHVAALGFPAVELPVRPGFQVEPEDIETGLPDAVNILADHGVRITSIAAALPLDDERLYAACAANGIPINRVMFKMNGLPYWEAEAAARRQLDAALPLCQRYDVRIGVQNHRHDVARNAMGLYHLLKDYPVEAAGAIWDPAHNALEGEEPEAALDIIGGHLLMVNLKNVYWQRVTGPEAEVAEWRIYWTSGRRGLASWPRVAAKLKAMGYNGVLCFSAEYSAENEVDRLIAEDLAFARQLFS